jgi:hydrogenase maturation protease
LSASPEESFVNGNGADYLIFGIGNCGRSDDGLGWAFLDRMQNEPGFNARVEYRYQLQPEDAALISQTTRVLFVDSYRGELGVGFQLERCKPSGNFEFTSHVLPPRAVMYLCEELYGRAPHAELLMIQGKCWELRNGLTPEAKLNLDKAIEFMGDHPLSKPGAP